jgi:hypothetical protein
MPVWGCSSARESACFACRRSSVRSRSAPLEGTAEWSATRLEHVGGVTPGGSIPLPSACPMRLLGRPPDCRSGVGGFDSRMGRWRTCARSAVRLLTGSGQSLQGSIPWSSVGGREARSATRLEAGEGVTPRWVRFPGPPLGPASQNRMNLDRSIRLGRYATGARLVERRLAMPEAAGSNPVCRSAGMMFNGSIPGFQPGCVGSIPTARSGM